MQSGEFLASKRRVSSSIEEQQVLGNRVMGNAPLGKWAVLFCRANEASVTLAPTRRNWQAYPLQFC